MIVQMQSICQDKKSQNIIKIVTDIKMCTFSSCSLTMQNIFFNFIFKPEFQSIKYTDERMTCAMTIFLK